jgi:hypothetical protein
MILHWLFKWLQGNEGREVWASKFPVGLGTRMALPTLLTSLKHQMDNTSLTFVKSVSATKYEFFFAGLVSLCGKQYRWSVLSSLARAGPPDLDLPTSSRPSARQAGYQASVACMLNFCVVSGGTRDTEYLLERRAVDLEPAAKAFCYSVWGCRPKTLTCDESAATGGLAGDTTG